jgi:replicative DNA helicase
MAVKLSDRDFLIDKVSVFAQERAMEAAILASIPLMEKGDFATILEKVRAASQVGAQENSDDYDYFAEIDSRTEHRVALAAGIIKPLGITTGFPDLDKHMFHAGWGRKELSVIMARAKFGKSMGLGEFGKSAWLAGYNVFIASCEVSREIYSDRLDANFADTAMNALKSSPFDVKTRIKDVEAAAKTKAAFEIRDYASGSLKVSQLRRTLDRYRARGIVFDLIITDYADIMAPERVTDNPREDSKQVWIDLRGLGYAENAAMLTATQTNRSGAKSHVAEATDVAEDYNKIRIADLVISGNANETEIKSGEARLKFVASRNQKEVTLRIRQERSKMKFLTKILGEEL